MTMMGTSSCQAETWLASFLYQKTHYILSHAICVLQNNSWFYWTGALTKGCTCMHIIILILSEIDIYFAYIYIYKFHSYPPLCSALFIWVNYTWPLKKKKKKKLAKFTKLLKPQNWKKKIPCSCFIGDMIGNFGEQHLRGASGFLAHPRECLSTWGTSVAPISMSQTWRGMNYKTIISIMEVNDMS